MNYQMTERKIDDFHILSPNTDEKILQNIEIKWDLENIAKTGSCTCLLEYIFNLIIYTRGATGSNMNLYCTIL
jgi:hypothetical protein